jgi:lipopolysaccharide biosynthesis protein
MLNSRSKIAICIYLYHTNLWSEFKSLLKNIPNNYDIFLGLCEDNNNSSILDDIKSNNIKIKNIEYYANCGADIAPFLNQLKTINFSKYKYIIKLHSKKSLFGTKTHVNWRSIILNSIIGSKKILKNNINTIDKDCSIGMLGPNGFVGSFESFNSKKIKDLCNILNMDYNKVKDSSFVAGSMFIVRSSIYKKYFTKTNIDKLLEKIQNNQETGKLSDQSREGGTYSHSMERIFGYIITLENKKIHRIKVSNNIKINNLSLIVCYNNDCYIYQDINCFGKYINIDDNKCLIEWKHIQDKDSVLQTYTKQKIGNKKYYVRSEF